MGSGFVDYEHVADRYAEGRSLPIEVLDRWRVAVRPYLPSGSIRVLDVGAGTGIFAGAWPRWTPTVVLALEPSAEMIRAGHVVDPAVTFVRGLAEALPVSDGCAGVVWVSTALHHFGDVHQAVDEIGRVLNRAGRVLVRTYAPGRTEVTWADEFPGRSKWQARFHRAEELIALFYGHGFDVVDVREVLEGMETYAQSAQWAARMRHADSMLTALNDDEIAAGLDILIARSSKVGRLELTLFVFERL